MGQKKIQKIGPQLKFWMQKRKEELGVAPDELIMYSNNKIK